MCILKGVSPDLSLEMLLYSEIFHVSTAKEFNITRTGDRDALTCARRCWSGFGASCRVWGEGGDSMSKTSSKRL